MKEASGVKNEIKKRTLSYIAAGLGFVTGLAWNEAIKALIDYWFPSLSDTLMAKFIYAFVLTFIIALVLFYLERLFKQEEKKD